ncbi:MAG TPA: AcvB/VirJ family lysyl-phosphatidylglycerol hydrolase [Candidatus Binatia bacterium]|nr:AcvB/VirJ family lysyl-phosphatidylglycerol hydrolase [Candidatus Binatia bacterium]
MSRTRVRRWRSLVLAASALFLVAAAPGPASPDIAQSLGPRLTALGLPLTLVWPAGAPKAVMVFFSGDGGWQTIDDGLAQRLKTRGMATIGWSSFTYFWRGRKPSEVATDLARVLAIVDDAGIPVYLGGYSFGAEMAPVTLARLPAATRHRVAGLVLLAPSASASFRVNPLDWVRSPPIDPAHRVDAALRTLDGVKTICLAGHDDGDSACRDLGSLPGVDVVLLPGDHHFGGTADGLATAIGDRVLGTP